MEKGYYIPEIEEFHVGFQCEFFNNMTTKKWVKEICDVDLVCMAYDIHEHGCKEDDDAFEDTFRVKYLDKIDIKELGITINEWFISKGDIGGTWKISAPGLESGHTIYIHSKDFIRNGSGDYTTSVMRFKIKNISELKVILKQVGIIKE